MSSRVQVNACVCLLTVSSSAPGVRTSQTHKRHSVDSNSSLFAPFYQASCADQRIGQRQASGRSRFRHFYTHCMPNFRRDGAVAGRLRLAVIAWRPQPEQPRGSRPQTRVPTSLSVTRSSRRGHSRRPARRTSTRSSSTRGTERRTSPGASSRARRGRCVRLRTG